MSRNASIAPAIFLDGAMSVKLRDDGLFEVTGSGLRLVATPHALTSIVERSCDSLAMWRRVQRGDAALRRAEVVPFSKRCRKRA